MTDTPRDQAAQELERITKGLYNCGKSDADAFVPVGYDAIAKEAKAALLALMHRETLAVIGEDVPHEKSHIRTCATYQDRGDKCTCGKTEKLLLIAQQRRAAAKRYGQIRSEA